MGEADKRSLVVVDGAGGFIGGHVAEEFHSAGYRVRATDVAGADMAFLAEQGIETGPSDLLDKDSLQTILAGADAVVHCAAAFDLALPLSTLMKVNVTGTSNLLEACLAENVTRVIHLSTGGVYGIPTRAPVYENHPIDPVDAYSVSKAGAEDVVVEFADRGIEYTMLRPTNVYGPRGRYTAGAMFPTLCILKERGTKIPRLTGGPLINMVHVEDVAGAVRFAVENDSAKGQAYNMAETEIYPAGDFFDLIIGLFSLPTRGSIKIRPGLMNVMGRLGMLLPESLIIDPIRKMTERQWEKIVEKHGLVPALKPALARDFMPFLIGPHAYSNEKLRNDGYEVRHPSLMESFPKVLKWYQDQRWVPEY